ncbi:MAG TPA: CocE/NonD family hydrolase [Solirubrobacterales bacterium]|nr:CocE/NonD family hydrolase [Solirubrobacterales bacterium]
MATLVAACASLALAGPATAYTAHGSMKQAYVLGATPGKKLSLVDKRGDALQRKTVSELGGLVFRKVEPGGGYRVKGAGETSERFRVLTTRSRPPDASIYDQPIADSGYQYLTTRDGTKLAVNVYPPTVPTPGPWPTLIEYSGYAYARPGGGASSIQQIFGALGFAVVDVNMRGTGCSGGSFDFFEPAQSLDGYDVVETIARQPWVLNHRPGMGGISYGGISQLFTGQTRPPSLAAIAPLSVLDQTQTTLYPGGILNTGFALAWAEERVEDARPAGPDSGQPWAYEQIQNGDQICKDNQALHPEAVDLLAKVRRNSTYKPKVADPLSPLTFVHKIEVPTFMACQWTDEQTGGHCPALAAAFTGTKRKWFTFTNGTHVDSLDPETFNRLYDFLELYVAQRKPNPDPIQIAGAPVIYQAAMGIPGVLLPPDPIRAQPDYASALAAFEAQPPIRILFDNGAGGQPGYPYPGFEQSFSRFPVPHTKATSFYLDRGGKLKRKRPKAGAADSFKWNAAARPPTDFTGDTGAGPDGLWTATPPYDWTQNPAGTAASYVTAPLGKNTTVLGAGALQAWTRSSKRDVDLQVTVSEVRPDGKETFVQGGWLKASARKLDRKKSTKLEPVLSLRKSDRAPMPKGRFAKLTIPLYYEGHVYRTGSRIRVTVSAPNGDQPIWSFDEAVGKGAKIQVAHSPEMPSRLLLPTVDANVPTGLPPCPGLRGEPCRDYVPYANRTKPLE